jgi:hypothetical protein
MTYAYQQRRKQRKKRNRAQMMAMIAGRDELLNRAAAILGRGFWGRLKWAFLKR